MGAWVLTATAWVRRSQGGFTLAELLVAVGLIAGLATVVLPNVGRFTEKGHEGNVASELVSVQSAMDFWGIDGNYPAPLPTGWTKDLLTGSGKANGVDLTGYLRLPGGEKFTTDQYCWDAAGTVRQKSATGGFCP